MHSLDSFIAQWVEEHQDQLLPTFRKLGVDKKRKILMAFCLSGTELSDPSSLSIKEVASKAEVSVGSLYQYFGDRDGMMTQMVGLISGYLIAGVRVAEDSLSDLPLRELLVYFVRGAQWWSEEEAVVAGFFYRGAYGGPSPLSERLIVPVSLAFRNSLFRLVETCSVREGVQLQLPLEETVNFLYSELAVLADSLTAPSLKSYLFPTAEKPNVELAVDILLRGVVLETRE